MTLHEGIQYLQRYSSAPALSHNRGRPSVLPACITLTVGAELAFAVPLVVIYRHIS